MTEVQSDHIEGKIERLKGREFTIIKGHPVFRKNTPFGIQVTIPGHTEGDPEDKLTAITFIVTSPEDDSRRSQGLLSRLGHNPLARIAAGVVLAATGAVGAGAALGACSPNNANNNPDQPTGLSTNQSALTYDQVLEVGPGQLIPWSEWGDLTSNYGEMDGEKYIFVGRPVAGAPDSVVYVKCQAIEDCLSADANVQTVQGLAEADVGNPHYGPGIFQDPNGDNKFIAEPNIGPNQICDISPNANGILEVSNCAAAVPAMQAIVSVFIKDGVPYALYSGGVGMKLRNLHTGNIEDIPFSADWADYCGVGFEAGNVVVGSQYQFYGGIDHCRLITAPTWEELANNFTALESLNNTSNILAGPRLAAGNILIYARYDDPPPAGGGLVPRLWYAVIPDAPQPNPEPDAGIDAGTDTQPAHPDIQIIPSPDTGPTPDALADDIADAADGAIAQPDTAPNPDTTPGPDATPGPDTPPDTGTDTTPTPQPDADTPPKPDTTPTPETQFSCDFAQAKINITEGACLFENCADPYVDITGKCAFEVDLGNPNPVIIEVDGAYNIDLLEKIGALLSGKYKVIDNGNQFDTVTGDFLTGVEGTIYRGQLLDSSHYFVACDEGTITIYLVGPNGEKTPLTTLEAGQEHTFDIDNPTANLTEPTPEQGEDTGTTEEDATGTPNSDATATPGTDASIDTSKPPSDPGCSCDTTSSRGNFTELGSALLAIAATLAIRRRQQLEQVIRHRPGTIIAAYARHTFDRLKRAISK